MARPKLLAFGSIFVALLVLSPFLLSQRQGIGSTDLEMLFEVRDSSNQQPIQGATIDVLPEGDGRDKFELVAGPDGRASRILEHWMFSSTKTVWKQTFGVLDPAWHFQVKAPGYSATSWLETGEYSREVRRLDASRSRILMIVELTRDSSKP